MRERGGGGNVLLTHFCITSGSGTTGAPRIFGPPVRRQKNNNMGLYVRENGRRHVRFVTLTETLAGSKFV